MVIYLRDARGRFAARAAKTPSRRAISAKGTPGAIRFDNQRQAGGWVMDAYTNMALTRKQAETIFRARGGSRKFFGQMWKQQTRIPRHGEAREQSLVAQRIAARDAGIPFRIWRARHYKGTKRYWEGADRDEWIAIWYPQIDASTTAKGA